MITVKKNGKERIYYTRCDKCGSEMEYEHSDIKYETSAVASTRRYIICPICGETISIYLLDKEDIDIIKRRQYFWGFDVCCD